MADITNPFPLWGETGSSPTSGFFYDGGDQVNEKHLDYLWNQLNKKFQNLVANLKEDAFTSDNGGVVNDGDGKVLYSTALADNETVKITQASLIEEDGTAIPSGVDLVIAVIGGSGATGSKVDIISGDGATIHDDQTGSPIASYQNTSGGKQTVAVVVDNGHYNAGSGSNVGHIVSCIGRTE